MAHDSGLAADTAAEGEPSDRQVVGVVFSKDRPLQLDAVLASLDVNVGDLALARVTVLYAASTPSFAAQYRIVALDHPHVRFRRESDFKRDLVDIVAGSRYVLFLVDDTIFVGDASLATGISSLASDPLCVGFSYRLGRNTTYCYTMDRPQNLPAMEAAESGTVKYDWPGMDFDFGYPLEVSSSLYRTADILPLLETLPYRNPNTLEDLLAGQAAGFAKRRPRLACYERSVAVSVPANLVQVGWVNRIGGHPELSADSLAREFGKGRRLDVAHYRGHVAKAAHEELSFTFTQRSDVPAVSIVIPCYKQAELLPDAVESVVAQTFTDWELVIVDDGSPDDTGQVADALAARHPTKNIRVVRQDNAGLSSARNAGIAVTRGEYVLPLDADDRIAPTMLERTHRLLEENPRVAIAYTDIRRFGDDDTIVRVREFSPLILPAVNYFSYCSLYRREVWEAVGGYNSNMVHGYEDWDFWVGAVEHGYRARRIPDPLVEYRIRGGTMYSRALLRHAELRSQLRRNHPSVYRWDRRLRRWPVVRAMLLKTQIAMAVRRLGSK